MNTRTLNVTAAWGRHTMVGKASQTASKTSEIGLIEFIDSFRSELATAMERAGKEKLQFQATKIDLELQIIAEKSGGPNAKVEFKIFGSGVTVGGDAKLANKIAHTVKLSLTPILDGQPVTPLISGDPVVLK